MYIVYCLFQCTLYVDCEYINLNVILQITTDLAVDQDAVDDPSANGFAVSNAPGDGNETAKLEDETDDAKLERLSTAEKER